MAQPKLTADQARRLHEADQAAARARVELERANKKLTELRDRYRPRVPLSTDKAEREKGVRVTAVAGISVRVTPASSGERFSLSKYKEAGHEITAEMRDAITSGKPYDRWTVKCRER